MTVSMQTIQCLALDRLDADTRLARKLPRDLAFRYHVLPLAEDAGHITVAMADPDDVAARAAVVDALGTMPYVVRGEVDTIDAALTALWSAETVTETSMLVYEGEGETQIDLQHCARSFADLMGARVSFHKGTRTLDKLCRTVERDGHDLVLCSPSCELTFDRLIRGSEACRLAEQLPCSLLVVRGFRFPLKRILWAVCTENDRENEAALEWITRMVGSSGTRVTMLVTVPPVPVMVDRIGRERHGITALLTANTPLGRNLRNLAKEMASRGIEGVLRLRQGPPATQLWLESRAFDYDLIVLSAESGSRAWRWLASDQIHPLLMWADRPVLIARKGIAPVDG